MVHGAYFACNPVIDCKWFSSSVRGGRSRPYPTSACAAKVYIAATHLEGMEGAESLLRVFGSNVQNVVALHTMTIIEEAVEGPDDAKVYIVPLYVD